MGIKVSLLLLGILILYLYEIFRLLVNYLKIKALLIYEPEIFLMIPIFFIYVVNFIDYYSDKLYYRNDLYLTVFAIGFFSLYVTIKISKNILRNLLNDRESYYKFSNFRLNLYANNILFFLGIFLFIIVFSKKGIPILSSDPDTARAQLGMGYILWPAFSFVNLSIWLEYIYLSTHIQRIRYTLFFFFKLILAIAFIVFTGWRGQIIQLLLVIVIMLSFRRKLSLKFIAFFLIFVFFIAFIGILRAYLSGKTLYGGAVNLSTLDVVDIIRLTILYLHYRFQEHFFNFIMTVDFANGYGSLYFKGLLMDLTIILPGRGQGLDFFLRDHLLKNDWIGGGGLPPTLFGSFYIEYKLISIILFSLIFGLILSLLYVITVTRRNTYFLPFYASSLVWAFKSVFGSIGQNFITYNFTMTFFMLAYMFFYFSLKNILKKKGG